MFSTAFLIEALQNSTPETRLEVLAFFGSSKKSPAPKKMLRKQQTELLPEHRTDALVRQLIIRDNKIKIVPKGNSSSRLAIAR